MPADWIACAAVLLRPKGGLTLIYPATRLSDLLVALTPAFGAIETIPLWPKPGRAAKCVVVRAVLGRKTPLVLSPGLVLHGTDGAYTTAARRVLYDAAALDEVLEDATC